jgi:hypothetical protein
VRRRGKPKKHLNSGSPGSLDYFCYVSRNKVDQLYEQIDPEAASEITELSRRESTVKAEASANWGIPHVLSLFRAGGSYGRTGVIQREVKVKETYSQKLKLVLAELAADQPIPPLVEDPEAEGEPSLWRHFEGLFQVDQPVMDPRSDSVITIVSSAAGREVHLDCSLRNFSEGPKPDGNFEINSANSRFFLGGATLAMKTVFLLISDSADKVVGSPLFLMLSPARYDANRL